MARGGGFHGRQKFSESRFSHNESKTYSTDAGKALFKQWTLESGRKTL